MRTPPPWLARDGEHRLIDRETLEVPRRLSREETRIVSGRDGWRTGDERDEEALDDGF